MRECESSSAGSVDWNGEEGEAVLLRQDEEEVISLFPPSCIFLV